MPATTIQDCHNTTTSEPKPEKKTNNIPRTLSRLFNSHHRLDSPALTLAAATAAAAAAGLSKTAVLETLRRIPSPTRSLAFFRWASSSLPFFPHHPDLYSALLRRLLPARRLDAARNLILSAPAAAALPDRPFNSLLRAYARAGLLDDAVALFRQMPSAGVRPTALSYNSLLDALLRRGRTHMARQLYHEMCDGVGASRPDLYTFNILIRGFCVSSMVEEGFWFFKEMSRFGCSPDLVTYNTLVDGLCRAGKVRVAHNLVKGMCRKGGDLRPNVVTFTTLIRGLCGKRMVAEALAILDEIGSMGLKPNAITYNTLVQGLSEANEFDKVKVVLEGNGGFRPDTCTFNTLMTARCNAGEVEEALKVFEEMPRLRARRDSASYSILIRGLCGMGRFEKAEQLFDELLKKDVLCRSGGSVPLVAAYNPMFQYLCGAGKTKKAENVFRRLMLRGLQDPPAFEMLIRGHCNEGAFVDGYRLLLLMIRKGFVPGLEIYASLIDGFVQQKKPALAFTALEKALKCDHNLTTATFHSVLDGLGKDNCGKEAANLITLMVEKRVRQNMVLSTNTVICLFKNKLKDRAFDILRLLYNKGYLVELKKVVEYLSLEEKFLWAREVLLFSLGKKQQLDSETYRKVVGGLCKHRKVMEGFTLFYQAAEVGNKLPVGDLQNLKLSLESVQRMKEAEFVHKQILRK